jgi:hypothetical protein
MEEDRMNWTCSWLLGQIFQWSNLIIFRVQASQDSYQQFQRYSFSKNTICACLLNLNHQAFNIITRRLTNPSLNKLSSSQAFATPRCLLYCPWFVISFSFWLDSVHLVMRWHRIKGANANYPIFLTMTATD